MTLEELARFASYLAREWVLPEAGGDDVLMWGATLAMRGCSRERILTHMEIRAELTAVAERDADDLGHGSRRTIGGTAQ